jgi:hypothetical protein
MGESFVFIMSSIDPGCAGSFSLILFYCVILVILVLMSSPYFYTKLFLVHVFSEKNRGVHIFLAFKLVVLKLIA